MHTAAIDGTWKKTLNNGIFRSSHFYLALCFNFLYYSNLATLEFRLHGNATVDAFALFMAFLAAYAGYYMLAIYREARDQGPEPPEVTVRLSYFAFRLYLIGLCGVFLCLGVFLLTSNK